MQESKKGFELEDFLSFQLEKARERTDNILSQFDQLEKTMSKHNGSSPALSELHDVMEREVSQSIYLIDYLELQLLRIEQKKEPLTALNPLPFSKVTKILLSFL